MISRRSLGLAVIAALVSSKARAGEQDFASWLRGLRADALAQGITANTLDTALVNLAPIPRVIELDRHQPETSLTFAEYIDRVVSDERREDARAHYRDNRALLDQVSARYGVDGKVIVALWGIETDFGRVTGGFPVIPALATLAYDGRRPVYFRRELLNALIIVDRQHIDPRRMVGSWAGAMGQSQFMPSSFLAYAVSFNGGGPPDIWNRREDVFASIANYLARVGWHSGERWGDQVTLPPALAAIADARRPVADWASQGIVRVDGKKLPALAEDGALVLPTGQGGPAFLAYDNFRVLLKWNNSSYFAIAVGFLADDIEPQ